MTSARSGAAGSTAARASRPRAAAAALVVAALVVAAIGALGPASAQTPAPTATPTPTPPSLSPGAIDARGRRPLDGVPIDAAPTDGERSRANTLATRFSI